MTPSCSEMERGLAAFAERGGVQVRYGCRWESTRKEEDGYVLVTSDGEYRCRAVVFALGVTDPWKSPIPGIEEVPHYAETPAAREFEGKSVLVIGKRNSGFEIADGLEPWARQIFLVSPRPVQTAVLAQRNRPRALLRAARGRGLGRRHVRARRRRRADRAHGERRLQAPRDTGRPVPGRSPSRRTRPSRRPGFRTPLQDLRELGLGTVADGRIPALTPYWESTTLAGVYFAGNTMQGAAGLRKNGVGSASGTVSGFRYNARLLAQEIAKRLGHKQEWQQLGRDDIVPFLLSELRGGPEIWTQKGYLARAVYPDGSTGIVPLAHFLDHCEHGSIAITIEMNAEGEIYPVVVRARA